MKNQKEKKKLYVVRSLRMTNWLCQRKFELLKVEDSEANPHFKVFLFADTPELRTSINQFCIELKREV
nr:MAG: hypothetical protein [Bacteriophage sp.]